ncbi:single-stranded DNA-binding protein [Listeria booriae]|uniref:single-stranded DNA-binding protein n=1 Tax=Listeria booriae TaxID=1552123 RepID=UPI001624EA8B|nr:single-stranded DNA-binding protein [Listeria booriae]MBC1525458.1 single-stranded DNA-binding protein [Listeria booriae]MBC6150082.1 single-stranded DNA-binding protein [Listeria booriae]
MMNRVVLVGRLTKDPELRYTPAGDAVATFTLAVNRPYKNANGEQPVDYINIVVWRKAAENAANFLKKGSLAGVDGRVQTRNYEGQDGKRVYVTEVLAESVQFLEPRSSQEAPQQQSNTNQSNHQANQQNGRQQGNSDPFGGTGKPIDISDDDLPF